MHTVFNVSDSILIRGKDIEVSELKVKPSKKLLAAKIEVVAFLHIFAIANQSIKMLLKVINVCEYNYGNRLSSHFSKNLHLFLLQ